MKKLTHIFVLLGLFFYQTSVTADIQANGLSQFLHDLPRLQADFVQQRFDEDDDLLERSEGQFFIQRPQKFRWVYNKPYQQLIVADDQYIWIYEQDLAQVTVKKASETLHNSPVILLMENDANLSKNFNLTAVKQAQTETITLTPKTDNGQFQVIKIVFVQQQLDYLEFIDALEQRTRIAFSNMQRNPEFDPKLFEFTPPEGVDLIDGRDG